VRQHLVDQGSVGLLTAITLVPDDAVEKTGAHKGDDNVKNEQNYFKVSAHYIGIKVCSQVCCGIHFCVFFLSQFMKQSFSL
jgi:hypothetical protein